MHVQTIHKFPILWPPTCWHTRLSNLIQRNTGLTEMAATFLYFAYGSNLFTKRIHINNPSAVRKAIGKLMGYRLDFNGWSSSWGGCSATIVPDKTKHVWGAVWEIANSHLEDLDRQEGVGSGWYIPIAVDVETPSGDKITCRCYQMSAQPPPLQEGEVLPDIRRPSPIYREVIIQGAYESGLPADYITQLKAIPHNNYKGKIKIDIDLPITS